MRTASRFTAISNRLQAGWLLLLPVLFLIPSLGSYWLAPNSQYSDLLIAHLPNAITLRDAILHYHQVPLWSSAILSGYPFAADPLSGLWYPPGYLAVIIPPPWGFNLSLLLHLVAGGLGLALFLRQEGISQIVAMTAGVQFIALPKTMAHIGAGHITLVYAVCWTPWLLWSEVRARGGRSSRGLSVPLGVVLGLIALADIRWIVPSGLLWLAYKAYRWMAPRHDPATGTGLPGPDRRWQKLVLSIAPEGGLALLIAAPLLLPLLQYTGLSTRAQMTAADALTYSLPPGRLLGLFFPTFGGSAEWVLYLGGGGAALLIYCLANPRLRRMTAFWWVVLAASLLLSLGGYLPGLRLVFSLPGLNLLRVPSRFLFLTGLSAVLISARAIEDLLQKADGDRAAGKEAGGLVVLVTGAFFLFLGAGLYFITRAWSFLWGGLAVFTGVLLVLSLNRRVFKPRTWIWIFLAFALVDLSVVNRMDLRFAAQPPVPPGFGQVEAQISKDVDAYRIYSPSYSVPQELAAADGLQLADGIDPLRLKSYDAFMQEATGVPEIGYSVTMPPFASAMPSTDNRDYRMDLKQLGLLNVKYVISAFDLPEPGLTLLGNFEGTRLYQNEYARPRAWVAPSAERYGTTASQIESLAWTPNRITIQASGPGFLVLSEISYPGWEVKIDGSPAAMTTAGEILRGVELPGGSHRVIFEYRPAWLLPAALLAGAGWLIGLLRIAIYYR